MTTPLNIETDFGINLKDIRDRIDALGYFLSVQDLQEYSQAVEGLVAFKPPAAFVSIGGESYEKQRYAAGGRGQRGTVLVSVMSVIMAQRGAKDAGDEVEQVRRGVAAILTGFKPGGAQKGLSPMRYAPRKVGDGLIWFEWIFETSFDLVGVREPDPPAP